VGNLTFGGIINDVQHRIAKTEIFTLEGYDAMSLRSLGEYLKFRHFFIQNNFTYMYWSKRVGSIRILVKKVNQGYSLH
jgi:DNA polymerase-3 subunit alpha